MVKCGSFSANKKGLRIRALAYCRVLAALCICCIPSLHAERLTIIVSGESAGLHAAALTIERKLQAASTIVKQLDGPDIGLQEAALADSDLLISIGNEAAAIALRSRNTQPLLCAFVSESTFRQELLKQFDSISAGLQAGVSALYFEQPPERMFELARLVVPDAKIAGMALGPVLQQQQKRLARQAHSSGLELRSIVVGADSNLVKALDPLVRQADLMMAMPDKAQWHSQTAKWLLYLTYRRAKPVIAFSARYTEAGAVASLYTQADDITEQAAAVATKLLAKPGPGAIYWPEKFHVSTNLSVAKALGLPLLDASDYERLLSSAGVKP